MAAITRAIKIRPERMDGLLPVGSSFAARRRPSPSCRGRATGQRFRPRAPPAYEPPADVDVGARALQEARQAFLEIFNYLFNPNQTEAKEGRNGMNRVRIQ